MLLKGLFSVAISNYFFWCFTPEPIVFCYMLSYDNSTLHGVGSMSNHPICWGKNMC